MLNNTTWTAQTLKENIVDHFQDANVSDSSIRLAVNFFNSLVGRAKRSALRSGGLKTTAVSVSTTGYDLSTISDIGSLTDGFRVYEGAIRKENELFNVSIDCPDTGYYLSGNYLFLNGARAGSVNIVYQEKTPRISSTAILSSYALPIDQDLEETIFRFTASLFFENQFQPDLMKENENKFYQEVLQFFSQPVKMRIINA